MLNQKFISNFDSKIGKLSFDQYLKNHTSMAVGGKAKYFFQTDSISKIKKIFKLCQEYKIKYFILGAGTNVIFSDYGFNGLIIKPNFKSLEIKKTNTSVKKLIKPIAPRYQTTEKNIKLKKSFSNSTPQVLVKAGASWRLNHLIQELLIQKITGLEWFYGIPGSLGGAVYQNIHGSQFFISDFISFVNILTSQGKRKTLTKKNLKFAYDKSIFNNKKDLIIEIGLNLFYGNTQKAKTIIKKWNQKKTITQSQNSAGCIFQNLDNKTQQKFNLPIPSLGYIIDNILKLKGLKVGQAQISKYHANFIKNLGNAKSLDIYKLTNIISEKFEKKFGFKPKLEVEFIGKFK